MARRFGSAMMSKADSTPSIYPIGHIHVKVYIDGAWVLILVGLTWLRMSLRFAARITGK